MRARWRPPRPTCRVDCVSLQASPTDSPPASAVTIGDASAIFQPNGAPAITIATTNSPATELGIADITEGTGDEVQAGDTVTVDYCGVGYGGLTVFDSSWTRGEPATFPLTGLIQGWQDGIPGMKVGGQRLLVIPGELGLRRDRDAGHRPQRDPRVRDPAQLDRLGPRSRSTRPVVRSTPRLAPPSRPPEDA